MKCARFEDLPVWKSALELARRVYALTRDRFFSQPGDLRDQLRRAALSVSNSVAEGFERGSTSELLAFLHIARGSAGEVRSMLRFVEGVPATAHLQGEIVSLIALAEGCSRQIRGWATASRTARSRGSGRRPFGQPPAGYSESLRSRSRRAARKAGMPVS